MEISWEEECKRHKAWEEVKKALIEGNAVENRRYKRCLKYGQLNDMTENCWAELFIDRPPT